MFGFGYGYGLCAAAVLECAVCRQYVSSRRQTETAHAVALLGCAPYAGCPACRQEVDDHKDRNYRARARRWNKKVRTR